MVFVDVGRDSPIYMMGASLGGITTTLVGALEPEIDAIIPITGGGRLTDVAIRSTQSGVPAAVMMPNMGPHFLTTVFDDGSAKIHTLVTHLNHLADVPIQMINMPEAAGANGSETSDTALNVGDTMVAENLTNGEIGCAYILPDETEGNGVAGRARLGLASDVGDHIEIRYWRGPVLKTGSTECELIEDPGEPILVVRDMPAAFNPPADDSGPTGQPLGPLLLAGVPVEAGPVRAFSEGLGLRRNSPELRRFMTIAQVVIDPTDPAVLVRHLAQDPLEYPIKGDRTGNRFLIVTTIGDITVPASTGITVGRAAGVVDFLNPDPRYGKPINQVLIDTYTAEAVNTLNRFTYVDPPDNEELWKPMGLDPTMGVHLNVENLSEGNDVWGENIPRLEQPLRQLMTHDMWGNDLGGYSGALFPYGIPAGQHGWARPGQMTDLAMLICRDAKGGSDPSCTAEAIAGKTYDVGWHMFGVVSRFFKYGETTNPLGTKCWSPTMPSCQFPPVPPARVPAQRP